MTWGNKARGGKGGGRYLHKVTLDPRVVIDGLTDGHFLAIDGGHSVGHIRELGGGVVAPDDDVLDLAAGQIEPGGNLNKKSGTAQR